MSGVGLSHILRPLRFIGESRYSEKPQTTVGLVKTNAEYGYSADRWDTYNAYPVSATIHRLA